MNTTIIYQNIIFVNNCSCRNLEDIFYMNRQFNNSNMRVVKQKTSNFTIIDNRILRDNNLSLKARGLLCFMLQLPENWVFTETGLAKVTGEGIRSIRSGLKELMDNKYLYRFQNKRNSGTFGNMIYYLFEEPTEMMTQNEDQVENSSQGEINKFILDKNHPDYEYINGGWMLGD